MPGKRKKRRGPTQRERKEGVVRLNFIVLGPESMRTQDEKLQQISLYQEYQYLKITKSQLEADVSTLRCNHRGDEEQLRKLAVAEEILRQREKDLNSEKFTEVAKNNKDLLDYLHDLHQDQNGNRIY